MSKLTPHKTIWVVSELFFPEETSTAYIMTKISQHLARSRNVHVLAGPASYQDSKIVAQEQVLENIQISRVKVSALDKDKLIQRVRRLLGLSWKLGILLFRKAKKGDDVLLVTNPAPLLILAAVICRMKGLKCYTIVHDVFPENLIAAGLIKPGSLPYKMLRSLFNRAYSRMSVLFVLGRDMQALFEQKLKRFKHKPALHVVENWADIDTIHPMLKQENALIRELDLSRKIVFQFAGNLGRVQGLMELFMIIRSVNNPLLHFVFIGEGAMKNELQQYIREHGLTNITMLSSMPRSKQQEFLNATDIGIVSLQDGMIGLGVPSKSYNILAAGKPILYIGDREGEIGRMVEEAKVGWCFKLQDPAPLQAFLDGLNADSIPTITQMGHTARSLAENQYAKELILDKYSKVFG